VIEYLQGAKAISEAMGLAKALVELGTAVRDHPPTSNSNEAEQKQHGAMTEMLGRLRIEALRVSKNLADKVRALADAVNDYGLSPTLSISAQLDQLGWYNFLRRSRLKSFREQCNSARRELSSLIDDATAMLICHGRTQLASEAFKASTALQKRLDDMLWDSSVTIRHQLRIMLDTATEIAAKLEEQG